MGSKCCWHGLGGGTAWPGGDRSGGRGDDAGAQPRLRVLLGLLGVAAGRMVTAEALVDGVWGEEWSLRREQNLHALVYQLRRRLGALEPDKGGARLARGSGGR